MSGEGHMRVVNASRALEADSAGSLSALRGHLSHTCRLREELARDRAAKGARLGRREADHFWVSQYGLLVMVFIIAALSTWKSSQFL